MFSYSTMAEGSWIMDDGSFSPYIPPDLDEEYLDYDDLQNLDGNEGYDLSAEQVEEFEKNPEDNTIKATDWVSDKEDDLKKITVTIDKARRSVWRQGRAEMEMLKQYYGNKMPPTNTIIESLFGSESKLFHLLNEELGLSFCDYCRFLATLFTAAELNVLQLDSGPTIALTQLV